MLQDLVKSKQRGGYVIPIIEQQSVIAGKKETMMRSRDVFHPSEIIGDFCPREWLICQANKELYLKRKINANTQLKFDVGSALHRLVQDKLGDAGVLFGKWHCNKGCNSTGCTTLGFKPKFECDEAVKRGIKTKWKFKEMPVRDYDLMIEGETDGIVILEDKKYVFEFKTIYDEGFRTLIEPIKWHKEQAFWYMDVLERNNYLLQEALEGFAKAGADVNKELDVVNMPFEGVVILYMNKNNQEMREFVLRNQRQTGASLGSIVKGDEDREERILATVDKKKEVLRETIKHYEDGTLPGRLEQCTSVDDKRPKKCVAKDICFAKEE